MGLISNNKHDAMPNNVFYHIHIAIAMYAATDTSRLPAHRYKREKIARYKAVYGIRFPIRMKN